MRWIMACAVLMVLAVASAEAQDGATPAKGAVTDATIIGVCGGRLTTMVAQFGAPEVIEVIRGNSPAEDDVLCRYGAFGFRVHNSVIQHCFFWVSWKGPIRGIKIGDSREDVVKVLGTAPIAVKDKNGVVTAYGFRMKDLGIEFYTIFDNDGRVVKVEIDPPLK